MKHYCFVVVIILCELVLSCHCLSCEVGYKAKASIGQPVNKMAIQECPDDEKDYECIQLNATFTFLFFSGEGSIGQCVVERCEKNSYCSDPLKLLPDVHVPVAYHLTSCETNCCNSDKCNAGGTNSLR